MWKRRTVSPALSLQAALLASSKGERQPSPVGLVANAGGFLRAPRIRRVLISGVLFLAACFVLYKMELLPQGIFDAASRWKQEALLMFGNTSSAVPTVQEAANQDDDGPTYIHLEMEVPDKEDKERVSAYHRPNGLMDVCRILSNCFPDLAASEGHEEEKCESSVDGILKYFHNGFLIESVREGRAGEDAHKANGRRHALHGADPSADGKNKAAGPAVYEVAPTDRLVGFISVEPRMTAESNTFLVYNVCIDPERRKQGLGKRIVPEFVDRVVHHYDLYKEGSFAEGFAEASRLDGTVMPRKPVIVGLDVDMHSSMAAETFSLYTKLGYVRWMTPCTSVYHFDHQSLLKLPANLQYPLAQLMNTPDHYLSHTVGQKRQPMRGQTPLSMPYSHFCMFKLWHESYRDIGALIKATVARMEANAKKTE